MVGGSIVTDDTCAVDTENDMQVLQRHVVDDIVVRALQEGGVDIAIGQHTRLR